MLKNIMVIEDTYTDKKHLRFTIKNIGQIKLDSVKIKLHTNNNDIILEMTYLESNQESTEKRRDGL